MSKQVKNMLVDDIKSRLQGVVELIVVNIGPLDAQRTTQLRKQLRQKNIHLQMVKNSLIRRATVSTQLAAAFAQTEGMLAIAWGGEDVVDLAKELTRISALKDFEGLQFRGGAIDGTAMSSEEVKLIAKWPNRSEQLSILSGQISSLGGVLVSQIIGRGATLASQIASRVEELEKQSPAVAFSAEAPAEAPAE
ncbi:MAG: 50S ribosomal protein L10 [Planctomycetota bacterium]|jgi:ribosomal protein L10|nr:50S ribosomal protein L10 [Planctomycetia bacterium]RLS61379.1 MAG: 50S ribosomal protein L10 [Planctomycetota bacterium]